jgi:hypothetical protein
VTADDKVYASIIEILNQNNNRGAKNGARIKPQRIKIEIKGMINEAYLHMHQISYPLIPLNIREFSYE